MSVTFFLYKTTGKDRKLVKMENGSSSPGILSSVKIKVPLMTAKQKN